MALKVIVTTVGTINSTNDFEWPEGWPLPREGEGYYVPAHPEINTVRSVNWYPYGDGEGDGEAGLEPYVYIVVGPKRRF